MNDDWSRCPICYENYSLIHRPTTFICGHSVCIDHTSGRNRLRKCMEYKFVFKIIHFKKFTLSKGPICRYLLNHQTEYNVSYNLEEAVH